jgi:hypothetical protein
MKKILSVLLVLILSVSVASASTLRWSDNFDDGDLDPPPMGSFIFLSSFGNTLDPGEYKFEAGRGGGNSLALTDYTEYNGASNNDWRGCAVDWTVNGTWYTDEIYVSWWERYRQELIPGKQNTKLFYLYFDPSNQTDRNRVATERGFTDDADPLYAARGAYLTNAGGGTYFPPPNDTWWAPWPNMDDGQWHHFEIYINFLGFTTRVWIDGVLRKEITYPPGDITWNRHIYYMYLFGPWTWCCPQVTSAFKFNRQIDDFELWDGMPGEQGDTTAPTFSNYDPARNITGHDDADKTVALDMTDASGMTQSSITMGVKKDAGTVITYDCNDSELTCSSITDGYTVTYTHPSNFTFDSVMTFTPFGRDASSNLNSQSDSYTVTIESSPVETLTIGTTSLPNGTVGVAYSQTLSASGGVSPYAWDNTTCCLPDGLSLGASTGIISGTPSVDNTFNFTARVTDTIPDTDTQALSIIITPESLPGEETLVLDSTDLLDTFVNYGANADTNYSSNVASTLYTCNLGEPCNRIMQRWDISSVPDNVTITAATLKMYYYANTGGTDGGVDPYNAYVYTFTTNDPTIGTVTWNNYDGSNPWTTDTSCTAGSGPCGGSADLAAYESMTPISKVLGWFQWDITNMVQNDYNADETYTYVALDSGGDHSWSNRLFASADYTDDTNLRPTLTITYLPGEGEPPSPPTHAPGRMIIMRGVFR